VIALAVEDHMHHQIARRWLAAFDDQFATCPITEGSLVRHVVRRARSWAAAQALLTALHEHPRHEFWPDDFSYRDVPLQGVIGHRQVTDAYLVAVARQRGARLATFDEGLAALHGDAVELIPTG
jgi:toxin-antitoxin system PIN domain toxin